MQRYFFPLLFVLVFFSACKDKYEIEPGSDFYFLAKALSLKFEALHPDSNFVLTKSKNHKVTANELLHVIQGNEGVQIQTWRNYSPVQIRENIRLRAEALLIKKAMLDRADALGIEATEAEIDSAYRLEFASAGKSEQEFLTDLKKRQISPELVKEGIEERLRISKFMEHALAEKLKVSEDELHEAYQESRNISFRHILLSTTGKSEKEKRKIRKKLADILKKINGGADFSEMAKEHSEDPGSASTGGLYQDYVYGRLDSAFAAAAFTTPIGEVSDIVESSFGYHIIKVIDRKNEDEAFEEAKPELKQQLKREKKAAASEEFLVDFKKEIGFELLK